MKKPAKKKAVAVETVLVLRCVRPDMTSSHGFVWPKIGQVEAPDFRADKECGHGLHGWLWGEGDLSCCDYWSADGALWLVVEVPKADVIDLDGKVKFPRGVVLFCGDRAEAAELVQARAPAGVRTIFGTATAGNRGTATAGDAGTATAGYAGTATAGNRGTATAGNRGTATAGNRGTATAGNRGTATAGDAGTATAGNRGTATAGDAGTATAGDAGTATAGNRGTATAGNRGTATAGDAGTATAGDEGVLSILWWDNKASRYRRLIGQIDGVSLKQKTPYHVVDGAFMEGKNPEGAGK